MRTGPGSAICRISGAKAYGKWQTSVGHVAGKRGFFALHWPILEQTKRAAPASLAARVKADDLCQIPRARLASATAGRIGADNWRLSVYAAASRNFLH